MRLATTYTDNLHLGMQLDKTDYFSMDVINENWQKIDAAVSGGGGIGGTPASAVPVVDGAMLFTIGNAEIDGETVDLLTEPYASHLYNKWFDDNTGQVDDTAIPNRVLCDLFIDIPDDRSSYTVQAAVSGSAGQFICYFYDANENFLSSQTVTSWVDSSTLNTIPNAKKLRVLMRLSSNADIAIGNISTFKVLFM